MKESENYLNLYPSVGSKVSRKTKEMYKFYEKQLIYRYNMLS